MVFRHPSWTCSSLLSALLVALFCTGGRAADSASKVREGNRQYEQKRYDEALRLYSEALQAAPGKPEIRYNLANTFYRQGKLPEATGELKKAAEAELPALRPKAHYNLGNALFQAGNFQPAIQEYIKALRLDPGDVDAKHNLELALKKMEQNQQKQDKDKQDKDKQDQQKQDKEKQDQQKQDQEKQNQQGDKQEQRQQEEQQKQPPAPPKEDRGNESRLPQGLAREDAERLLQAITDKERQELLRQLEKVRRSPARGRDW